MAVWSGAGTARPITPSDGKEEAEKSNDTPPGSPRSTSLAATTTEPRGRSRSRLDSSETSRAVGFCGVGACAPKPSSLLLLHVLVVGAATGKLLHALPSTICVGQRDDSPPAWTMRTEAGVASAFALASALTLLLSPFASPAEMFAAAAASAQSRAAMVPPPLPQRANNKEGDER